MDKLTIDFETRSAADIKASGAAAYAQHETTEVICLALKPHGEDPVLWFAPAFQPPTAPASLTIIDGGEVARLVRDADSIEAHNAQFEYFIWKYVMCRYGFEMFDASKLRCSAAKAATCGLPRDLENACLMAGVPQQKDTEGHRLMLALCKPRAATKSDMRIPGWNERLHWRGDAADFVRLAEYCCQDVRAEEALSDKLPDLLPEEQKLWQLDLAINDRGIRVDVPAAQSIVKTIAEHSEKLTTEFQRLTGLQSPAQRQATLEHLWDLGVEIDGLTKADVSGALDTVEDKAGKRILEIRQSLAKSSTAKYNSLLTAKGTDDRVRGCFMYCGAGTGRWSGRLIQPQNFPRGTFHDVDDCIRLFQLEDLKAIELFYGDPMVAASTCLRGMLIPSDGCDFVCADYSSIEGRVLAWLAGEETALNVYREGKDPYRVAAAAIYHVPYASLEKSDPRRQIGKVAELALGYQGAKGAFSAMAAGYGVKVAEKEVMDIVAKWRESRPRTVALWHELEGAARSAIEHPGAVGRYRGLAFKVADGFLRMRLPSGRCLWYAEPRIELRETDWGTKEQIAFSGVNSVTRKWSTQYLYGGLLTENATQAVARDLLVSGMFAVEAAGYRIVMHVHDELVAEREEGQGSVEEFENLMCTLPDWANGLPIKAEGWRGKRYKK